jgi:hypothetical protein
MSKVCEMADHEDLLAVPTQADRERLDALWRGFFDMPEHADIHPSNRMAVWAIEHQVKANRLSTAGLIRATRGLVWATVGLVIATLGQVLFAVLNYLQHK